MSAGRNQGPLMDDQRTVLARFRNADMKHGDEVSHAKSAFELSSGHSGELLGDQVRQADEKLATVRNAADAARSLSETYRIPINSIISSPNSTSHQGDVAALLRLAKISEFASTARDDLESSVASIGLLRAGRRKRNGILAIGGLVALVLLAIVGVLGVLPCGWLDSLLGSKSGCVAALRVANDGNLSVAVSPFNQDIAVGGNDGVVRLFNLTHPPTIEKLSDGSSGYIDSLAFSPDGRYLVAGHADGTIPIWDTADGRLVTTLSSAAGVGLHRINVAFSPNGKLLAAGAHLGNVGVVSVWSFPSLIRTARFENLDSLTGIAFSPSSVLAVAARGEKGDEVRLWDSATSRWLPPIPEWAFPGAIAFSPDDRYIAIGAGSGNDITIWDWRTAERVADLKGHTYMVMALVFNPDGRVVASAGADDTIRLWSTESWKEVRQYSAWRNGAYNLAFYPDGIRLVSGGAGAGLKVWKVM